MKKTAKSSNEATGVIVSDSIANVSDVAIVDLPNKSCLNRTVQRQRAKNNPQLTNPVDRVDLVIPHHFSTTQNGEKFLLHDSGGKNRYLLFSTQANLRFLSNCKVWMVDGTFKCVPATFLQLYTIHGMRNGKVLPLAYILAPNKTARLYTEVLKKLIELKPDLKPKTMIVDYEKSFINGLKACFPTTKIRGCHFHYGQCIYRHVQ
ncbi:uncharacterized protein LOC130676955 [Microplitis mediator]|uniref:uncharacterized protein LOC130676955 n=1 Tax=Microplitis mediator TaxID=375433 RepID=UPI00255409C7|nr:uncharacterized protein LOC130676955 [Microplitis mediator]